MHKLSPTEQRTSRIYLVITFIIAGVLLVLAFRGVNWSELFATLCQGRLDYLLLGIVILSVTWFVRGIRWRILLNPVEYVAPFTMFWAVAVGYLGNGFLPARAGELMRSVMIGRRMRISKSYALATALTERVLDLAALVLVSLLALLLLPGLPDWLLTAAGVTAIVAAVGTVGLFVTPLLRGVFLFLLNRLPLTDALHTRFHMMVEAFLLGMQTFRHPGRAAAFLGLALVIWLMDASSALMIAQALNLTLTLPQVVLLLASLGLSSTIPSTPGYVGVYQFVAVTVLPQFGISQSSALAYILALQAMTYITMVLWGFPGLYALSSHHKRISTEQARKKGETL
jgi:glycosyltransferase 2 family protein